MKLVSQAVALGVVIGVVYSWSPLLIVALLGFALLLRWVRGTPDPSERRWLVAMFVIAIVARIAVVAALFLSTNHDTTPFGRLFGDEEYFVRRGVWLANLALGIPISIADVRYAFDELIHTSFVWMLAALNVVFGPAPYGLRFISAVLYLWSAFALYRIVRPSFGKPASLAGLALLLFLPSLFIWSISVLKEPVFFAVMSAVVVLTVAAGRRTSWAFRFAAVVVVALAALLAETIRDGGAVVVVAGTAIGMMTAVCVSRPRLLIAAAVVALAATPALLANGRVKDRITAGTAAAARRHWDQVHAPGHSYLLLAPAFYREEPVAGRLSASEQFRLAAGGLAAYVVVPLPWQMQSRAELAYLPEQVIWYGLVLFLPIGVAAGLRRDVLLTSILLGHLFVSVALVALTSGNIGTLVRHRALAMPYVVWFSGLGLSVALAWLAPRREGEA